MKTVKKKKKKKFNKCLKLIVALNVSIHSAQPIWVSPWCRVNSLVSCLKVTPPGPRNRIR